MLSMKLYPDPILRKCAAVVTEEDFSSKNFNKFIDKMFVTMQHHGGLGLAAPQVGLSKRLFIMSDGLVFTNPVITSSCGEQSGPEACLSFPGLGANIVRAEACVVLARGRDGKEFEYKATDIIARCVQHELDHLNGVLLTHRMTNAEKMIIGPVLKQLRRRYKLIKKSKNKRH